MRASKSVRSQKSESRIQNPKSKVQNPKSGEIHISGAEGLYDLSEIAKVVKAYIARAMGHSRGLPDSVVMTIEKIRRKPATISLLPISTVQCASPEEAKKVIKKLLIGSGITKEALQNSLRVINGKTVMRGAALIDSYSGSRSEPDRERGIRVSRLGITKAAASRLSKRLAGKDINTTTVKEALVLASKVASCEGIIAELCVSDDPDYTTGYIASKELGYVRITNIKHFGSLHGGRVFFIDARANIERMVAYLEKTPVIAS